MKNQALTTTLAVLLAVSLSALVALIVSTQAIGGQTVADLPAAIEIVTPEAPQPPTGDASTNDDAAVPVDTDEAPTPSNDNTRSPAPATNTDQTMDDAVPVPGNNDEPTTGEPPCEGEIVDSECVPPVLILCQLGYEYVGDECVYIGCPVGYLLEDGICELLVFQAPCDAGFQRIGDVCLPILVIDPGQFEPLCFVGQHVENGVCVPDDKVKPDLLLPGLELATNG
ncbi:MAG: hypothetical protein KC481_05600 [Acidimicrobiaceae bacterium]|nr:hypothetical protein [Acidimicrobiaceae bacterium]